MSAPHRAAWAAAFMLDAGARLPSSMKPGLIGPTPPCSARCIAALPGDHAGQRGAVLQLEVCMSSRRWRTPFPSSQQHSLLLFEGRLLPLIHTRVCLQLQQQLAARGIGASAAALLASRLGAPHQPPPPGATAGAAPGQAALLQLQHQHRLAGCPGSSQQQPLPISLRHPDSWQRGLLWAWGLRASQRTARTGIAPPRAACRSLCPPRRLWCSGVWRPPY